jgi:hypothetical protein
MKITGNTVAKYCIMLKVHWTYGSYLGSGQQTAFVKAGFGRALTKPQILSDPAPNQTRDLQKTDQLCLT